MKENHLVREWSEIIVGAGGGLLCLGGGLQFFELGFGEGLKFLGFSLGRILSFQFNLVNFY